MADVIKINKSKIPYKIKVKFSNGIFRLGFRYNKESDRFFVDLYTEDDILIQESEKMVFGMPLWWIMLEDLKGNHNPSYPPKYLIPSSYDGTEKEVNLENLGEEIFLKVVNRGTKEVEFDFLTYKDL